MMNKLYDSLDYKQTETILQLKEILSNINYHVSYFDILEDENIIKLENVVYNMFIILHTFKKFNNIFIDNIYLEAIDEINFNIKLFDINDNIVYMTVYSDQKVGYALVNPTSFRVTEGKYDLNYLFDDLPEDIIQHINQIKNEQNGK